MGKILTLWTIRFAALFYIAALSLYLARRSDYFARLAWTAGFVAYAVHVGLAFHFFHGWSHSAAYLETARQTQQMFRLDWGGGLFLNYLFTSVWLADTLWWWKGLAVYRERPLRIASVIHSFLAFMFFNATVVFGQGLVRFVGIFATIALLVLWRRKTAG